MKIYKWLLAALSTVQLHFWFPTSSFLLKLFVSAFVYQCASLLSVGSCFLDIQLKACCFLCNKHVSKCYTVQQCECKHCFKIHMNMYFKDVKHSIKTAKECVLLFQFLHCWNETAAAASHMYVHITHNMCRQLGVCSCSSLIKKI